MAAAAVIRDQSVGDAYRVAQLVEDNLLLKLK